MAKQIYIDENGNEQLVSGTINNASMLPISASDSTNTKSYIDSGLSGVNSTIATIGVTESIFLMSAISTTRTNYDTYNNRKFSDYDFIIFRMGSSSTDTRNTIVIPKAAWDSGQAVNMGALHGANVESVTSYSYSSLNIQYYSDTKISAIASGSATLNYLAIYGLKIRATT